MRRDRGLEGEKDEACSSESAAGRKAKSRKTRSVIVRRHRRTDVGNERENVKRREREREGKRLERKDRGRNEGARGERRSGEHVRAR